MQLELLKAIWSLSPGEYVSLPLAHDKRWNNGPLWGKDVALVSGASPMPGYDYYFSPLTYDDPDLGRRRDNITAAGVLFADMDGLPDVIPASIPAPTLTVASGSPGHWHWYWFLDQPVDISTWELHARGTTEALHGDPGGWDSTQVLRIPGSVNHKHTPPGIVTVGVYEPKRRYPVEIFPQTSAPVVRIDSETLPPLPIMTAEAQKNAVEWAWPRISVEDRLLLLGRERARDRSKVIWRLIQRWRTLGFSEGTIYILLRRAPFNKYSDEKLWAQIHKA